MKKIKMLFFCLFLCCFYCVVNAETLNISYVNEEKGGYLFEVLVNDVKDQKINVIAGNIKYDKALYSNLELVESESWKLYTKVNGSGVSFVLVNISGYATENMNVFDIMVSFDVNNVIDFDFYDIQSGSNNSILSITDVNFKYEILEEEIVIPNDDFDNNIINDKEDESKLENNSTVESEKDENNDDLLLHKDSILEIEKNNFFIYFVYVLVAVFVFVIIVVGIVVLFVVKKGKKN